MGELKDFTNYLINYWVLIPSVAIILLLSFLEKRRKRRDLCDGRPALLIPFHFLDGYDNRMSLSMAFGTATGTVVSLITTTHNLDFELPLWARALYVYLQAIVGCLTCYPLFACLTTRYRAVGAILCIVYSLLWLAINVASVVVESNQIEEASSDTISVNVTKAYVVLSTLPIMFCYLMLIMHCLYTLHKCVSTKIYFNKRTESTVKQHQEDHVRWVLRQFRIQHYGHDCMSSLTFVDQMKSSMKLRYFTNFPFFKYPARIVALSFVQLNILYWTGILLMLLIVTLLHYIISSLSSALGQFKDDLIIILSSTFGFALVVCILNSLTQIFVVTRNYRYDMLRIYQGNRTFVPVSNETPQNILTRNMTFPGYQMAFNLWGIIVCFTTVFLLTLVPTFLIYFAVKLDSFVDLLLDLAQILSFPAIALLVFYLLVFMAKRVLLQEKVQVTDENPPLNVDNRKFYEIVNYYSLFTNMAVGIMTCLFRIVESIFFGIFSVGRLDRSVFPRELESWDRGYSAYISMLLVDNAHNNPCMRVFAHLLWTRTLAARSREVEGQEMSSDIVHLVNNSRRTTYGSDIPVTEIAINMKYSDNIKALVESNEFRVSKQANIRWHLARTLINNPQLRKLRKEKIMPTGHKH